MGRPPFTFQNLGSLTMNQQNFDMLKQTTADLQAKIRTVEAADAEKTLQITALNTELGQSASRISTLNQELSDQKTEVSRLARDLADQKGEVTRLTQALDGERVGLQDLRRDLDQERSRATDLGKQLKLRDEKIGEIEALLANRDLDLETLREGMAVTNRSQTEVNAATPIAFAALAKTIGDQATSARDDMSSKGMRISNMSVTLRALPTEDGTTFRLPGARALDSKALSDRLAEFKFDIEMLPPRERPDTAAGKVPMPDLAGMTSGAATQVMVALGLRMIAASGAPNRPGIVAGQAFRQQIAPRTPLDRGTEVIVVFATEQQDEIR
jgi:hypothetical protein